MQKYVHKIEEFDELFKKLSFGSEKYGSIYSAMMFQISNKERLADFEEFLLKYIRISDTMFSFSEDKIFLVLEDTTIRWAINLCENLSEKVEEKWFTYKYFVSAIQWDYIETEKKLFKALKKRLKKAREEKIENCVIDL